MNRRATATIVGLVLILFVVNWSRFARDTGEPALLHESSVVWIELGVGFSEVGLVRQFIGECCLADVIGLTNYTLTPELLENYPLSLLLDSGRRVDLVVQGVEIQSISFSWITAGQRSVLGIPLHPDCMSQKDWEYLPGIGEKMAVRIEENRQNYGDFGSLEGLRRIKGVGSSKLAAWKEFFLKKN